MTFSPILTILKLKKPPLNAAFATYARAAFLRAQKLGKTGLEIKKEILRAIDKTPIIKFVPIANNFRELEKEYLKLEPTKMPMNQTKTEALASVRAHWLPLLNALRTVRWRKVEGDITNLYPKAWLTCI